MPVRIPLQDALDYRKVQADIPDRIEDTLRGYALAVNWLVRTTSSTVPFTVTFGWQVNLWGVSTVTKLTTSPSVPMEMASALARMNGRGTSTFARHSV